MGKILLRDRQIDYQRGENILLKGCKRELQTRPLKKQERIEIRMSGTKLNMPNHRLTGHILLMSGSEGKVCRRHHLFLQALCLNQLEVTGEKKILNGGLGVPGIFKGHLPGATKKKGGNRRRMLHCFRMMGSTEERKIFVIENVKIGMFYQTR
jgi:hypothetical protein